MIPYTISTPDVLHEEGEHRQPRLHMLGGLAGVCEDGTNDHWIRSVVPFGDGGAVDIWEAPAKPAVFSLWRGGDVPHTPPFDPVRRYSIHWVSPGYLNALGGSIFSAVDRWCACKQYVGYVTALCENGGAQ